jgi:NAD-dependent deacetylase
MLNFIEKALMDAAMLLRKSTSIVILSGAGISKASGIPTYRDVEGLWKISQNLQFSDVDSYNKNPKEFMDFWKDSIKKLSFSKPNPAHFALRDLQKLKDGTVLVTQNVDGLLQKAGCTNVIELHGSLRRLTCDECGLTSDHQFDRCLRCGSLMRPAVVLFGQMLDENLLKKAQLATLHADLVILVGTRAEVYPAASIPFSAFKNGTNVLVIDTETTAISDLANVVLKGKAEELLPKLIKMI